MLSFFLAKVLGTYVVLVCLAVLLRRRSLRRMLEGAGDTQILAFISGALVLILGLLVVISHNVWTSDYRGVITFLGWLTVFKGVVRLFFPDQVVGWSRRAFRSIWYTPLIVLFLLLGLWLAAVGFGWV